MWSLQGCFSPGFRRETCSTCKYRNLFHLVEFDGYEKCWWLSCLWWAGGFICKYPGSNSKLRHLEQLHHPPIAAGSSSCILFFGCFPINRFALDICFLVVSTYESFIGFFKAMIRFKNVKQNVWNTKKKLVSILHICTVVYIVILCI